MQQTTIIEQSTTETLSADIVVAPGVNATIGTFSSTGEIPMSVCSQIYIKTPAANTLIGSLTASSPVVQVQGPATIIVKKLANVQPTGVFLIT